MHINNFSLLLKQYINESQYNVVTLSKLTNISRSSIQKFMSGIQIPKNYETIEKLIQFLPLSIIQKDELKKAYMIEQVGYLNYQKMTDLKEFIQSFNTYPSSSFNYNLSYKFNKINKFAHNPEELKLMLHFIIEDALNHSKQIKILMNADNPLFEIIYQYAKNYPDLVIKQIVNFKNLGNDVTSSNLEQLEKLLPLLLLKNKTSIKYIYGKENNPNYYSIFPYSIASDNYIILINSDYTLGMLINENQKYLINEFNKKNKLAKKLIYKSKNKTNYINTFLNTLTNQKNTNFQIFSHISLIYTYLKIFNQNQSSYKNKLNEFLQNNHLTLYLTSDQNTDKKSFTHILTNDHFNIHIINKNKINFPDDLLILNTKTSLILIFKNINITIYENTICQDFQLLDKLFISE
ncbi:helix-turn-helix domain-containing protein [Thomasclavelia spiroformis]|uniref:helix-turn-helix domain-containing protein n=1 Tax=Thomasclavelia spiroformis TaxID=29348 RepID=UPI002676D45C|nr:helix-turn-helix transcriptional regulator [Thomasclavelia spiroformis]